MILNTSVFAKPIDIETAKQIGANFLKQSIINIQSEDAYYILQSKNGFVILATDDVVNPIIGYSYNNPINTNDLPPALKEMLDNKAEQIHNIVENKSFATHQVQQKWQELLSGKKSANEFLSGSGDPLIKTKWRQSEPYNWEIPMNDVVNKWWACQKLVGCVALSMGQIMHYWEWPKYGKGFHIYSYVYSDGKQYDFAADFEHTKYEWEKMRREYLRFPEGLIWTDTTTDALVDSIISAYRDSVLPVTTLLYHCGVSVRMKYDDYGKCGQQSSARVSPLFNSTFPTYPDTIVMREYNKDKTLTNKNAFLAFTNHFRYPESISYLQKSRKEQYVIWDSTGLFYTNVITVPYTDEEWIEIIKNEIDNKRPILYVAYDDEDANSGHAFVCDGYDGDNMLHFNWGWGGDSDGYYNVNNKQGFNRADGMIIGIESPEGLPDGITENNIIRCNISPNPINTQFTLNLDLWEIGNLNIKLVDLLGNEIAELYNNFENVGQFTKTFSLESFLSGTYFLKINHNENWQCQKLIKK